MDFFCSLANIHTERTSESTQKNPNRSVSSPTSLLQSSSIAKVSTVNGNDVKNTMHGGARATCSPKEKKVLFDHIFATPRMKAMLWGVGHYWKLAY